MTVQERVQEHYNEAVSLGYEVVGVFLQGSQNYGLEYENSDVDTKAILLPTFNDFCLTKSPISTTHVRENNEHIDLKDIRLMVDCFKKQNINFIEVLFTKYKVLTPEYEEIFYPLFKNRELIAHYNNYASVNCIVGMSMEKYKALEHPYPTIKDKIEKYGYDPKQLHHILRLNEFMKRYISGENYEECLRSKRPAYLIEVKKGLCSLKTARELAKEFNEDTKMVRDRYMENTSLGVIKEVEELMSNVTVNLMKHYFKKTFRETI